MAVIVAMDRAGERQHMSDDVVRLQQVRRSLDHVGPLDDQAEDLVLRLAQ